MMVVGRVYTAELKIFHDSAYFWLDGKLYYSCKLKLGDVADGGKIGFTSYSGQGSSKIFGFQDLLATPENYALPFNTPG